MKRRGAFPRGASSSLRIAFFPGPVGTFASRARYFFLHVWSHGRSIMKHALIAIAGVGILVATAGVETANAQYSPPPPPSYTPPPAYSPAPAYAPAPRYTRRAYRRTARHSYGAPP